jgi:threonylcarbamoyladenosine tRNA methylthiotransferase MtaB
MKVAIQTLGCKVNQSESSSIEGTLINRGCEIVKHSDNPDIFIVNTCSVTAKSDYQSRQIIRRAVKTGARVVATGCYAQLRPEELTRIKGLDLIIGNSNKDHLYDYLSDLTVNTDSPLVNIKQPVSNLLFQPYHSSRARAFLKIQDGCNFSCTYCTVPRARGMSRSLLPDDVMKSVDRIVEDGYREIVLTGIHIGAYGLDLNPACSLLSLVKKITSMHSSIRVRISSIEPQEIDVEFLHLMQSGSVCSHLHIPLQSGSEKILKMMGRRYSVRSYEQLINSIVEIYPHISLGTDIIVGFPGEGVKEFNETVSIIKQLPFTYLHVFPYSPRPDTEAAVFDHQIRDEVKKSRVDSLIEIGKKRKSDYIARQTGKILDVIVEQKHRSTGFYKTISDNYLPVFVSSSELRPRDRIKVRVTTLTDGRLYAEPLE